MLRTLARRHVTATIAVVVATLLTCSQADGALTPGPIGFGGPGADDGSFMQPGGIAYTSDAHIWVADTGNGRLQLFTGDGALVRTITGFTSPTSVSVGPDDSVYVADQAAGRVVKLRPDGTVDPAFSQDGLQGARAVAVDPRGDFVYVVETATGRLDRLSAATGVATGLLVSGLVAPSGVAVDADGTIAVSEQGENKIAIFDGNGTPVARFGSTGADAGSLSGPAGLAFDPYGLIVVADTGNGRIQRFTENGSLVDALGGLGSPVAVASDEAQTFAVLDSSSSRVAFADDALPPPTLGQTVNVARLEGTIVVRPPGGGAPRPLIEPRQIQVGADIDTTQGTLRLVTAQPGGRTQRATIYEGRFTVTQPASGVPTATLTGTQLDSCPARSPGRGSAARLPSPDPPEGKPKRAVRTRVKGQFKTNGSSASADVKGTDYEVADYCSGTLVTVYAGTVKVARKADGVSALVSGTFARPGRRFVKAPPAKRKKASGKRR
jgi:DNA-binding beta-propeller fold protein YncE